MFSKFITSFSYMGSISNNNPDKELESMEELSFLAIRPTLELPNGSQVPRSELGHDHHHHQDQNFGEIAKSSSLGIVIPSFKNTGGEDREEEDGSRTPRSLEQRIPLILTCPLAPKKPKTLPSKKRKAPHHRNIMLHLSSEIQSLFPSAAAAANFVEDLGGMKIKRAKEDFCVK